MIETGWIFPDGTEYSCGGDSSTGHDLAVAKFIRGLRFQDLETQRKINQEIDDLFFEYGSRNLYSNYAIRRLGWIKVGTSIWHDIKYAGYDWQADLVKPYDECGYHPDNMYFSSNSYLPIKCNILLAIRNGGKRYHEDGSEYCYDGTDKDDSYIDENGNIGMAHWNKETT